TDRWTKSGRSSAESDGASVLRQGALRSQKLISGEKVDMLACGAAGPAFLDPPAIPQQANALARRHESMSSRDQLQRSTLPIPDPQHVGVTTYDAKDPDTKFPPIEPLLPPKGAPNVLVVLLDDVGFAASSAFGGPIHT